MKASESTKKITVEAKAAGRTINAILDKHKAELWRRDYPASKELTEAERLELHEATKAIVSLENAALIIKRIR